MFILANLIRQITVQHRFANGKLSLKRFALLYDLVVLRFELRVSLLFYLDLLLNGERFRKWAVNIGENTAVVVESILSGYKVEQQGYRACMALLKLSDQYTKQRLESACEKALDYTPKLNYKTIQTILKSGQDRISRDSAADFESSEFGFTRGADYYKGGRG